MKNVYRIALLLFVVWSTGLQAQTDSINYTATAHFTLSKQAKTPFWIHNNTNGDYSLNSNTSALELGVSKGLQHPDRLFDYGFGLTGHISAGEKLSTELHELYVSSRIWVFNVNIGQRIEHYGNQDPTLSSGGYLFSNNYVPIPKVFVGIENFTPVIFKHNFLEIKGGLSHGWFTDDVYVKNMLYHHKYAYIRLGGNKSPFHWQYGFDHVAEWGGNIPNAGQQPTGLKDFVKVFFMKSGNSSVEGEKINVGGNHIIAQSTRFDLQLGNYEIGAYWQLVNEDKPIQPFWSAVNLPDGLWGLSIKNKSLPWVNGFLFEYLNTTDQNGPIHDKDGIVYGGSDTYFNNYLYRSGWTHHGYTIGNPFLTSPVYNTDGAIYIKNTRVQVFHFGLEGDVEGYRYRVLNSYSKNYGNYGEPFPEKCRKATSLLVEVNKHYEKLWGIDCGLSLAADWGKMYGNNVGILLKISKRGNLFSY